MDNALGTLLAMLFAIVLTPFAFASGIDAVIRGAMRDRITRSAITLQLQGQSDDIAHPFYPIEVPAVCRAPAAAAAPQAPAARRKSIQIAPPGHRPLRCGVQHRHGSMAVGAGCFRRQN